MLSVINKFNVILLLMICFSFLNSNTQAVTSSKINVSAITTTPNSYTLINNEAICGDKKFGTFSSLQRNILKQNNLWGRNINWLGDTYHCAYLNNAYLTNTYIHTYHDKNSPLYVYILLNRSNRQYLLAKITRNDWLELISNGKIAYTGSLKDSSQAKSILQQYISNQNYY